VEAFMYILKCGNGDYYTGSTKNLERRIQEHQLGLGAKLVYFEVFDRIDLAFLREKQVQKWSKAKKEALIDKDFEKLKSLSKGKSLSPSH
jgi:putative endonuclease